MKNVISTVPRTLSHGENTTTDPCEIATLTKKLVRFYCYIVAL